MLCIYIKRLQPTLHPLYADIGVKYKKIYTNLCRNIFLLNGQNFIFTLDKVGAHFGPMVSQ